MVAQRTTEKGFTLIELLVALVVMGIFSMGAVNLFISQHQEYIEQNDGILATQNARAGLDMMVRELRNAGYDPRDLAGAGVTTWVADSFGWTADLNADGDVADTDEAVVYYVFADSAALFRQAGGVNSRIADGITELTLSYFSDAAGTVATAADEIRQIEIHMEFDTPDGTMAGEIDTQVALRNNIYE